MLAPKRAKYRKQFRENGQENLSVDRILILENMGSKLTCAWVTSRQIEAARRALTHYTKRGGRIWIRVFPDKPITKKPPETRMGSGKGDVYEYVAVVRPGRILFEMSGVTQVEAKEAMRLASAKLPVRTHFMVKE